MAEADNQVLLAQILSSYLSNNSVAAADLQSVINTVKKAFSGGVDPFQKPDGAPAAKMQPVVLVKTSVSSDAIACLSAGKNSNRSNATCKPNTK